MSEEQVVSNEPQEGVVENSEPEISLEDRAKEQGWRPKEEFDGDKSKWVSAETFLAKGELIEKIETLGKELKNTKKAMTMLQDHHKQVKAAEFTRAVNFLKQQKKQAYESGDVDKLIEIDEQIATVKETQKRQTEVIEQEQEVHPEFSTWANNNQWYNNDNELREAADGIGLSHAKNNPDKSPAQVLEFVTKKIKVLYPEKFTNTNRNRPSAVEGTGNSASRRANSERDVDMSEEELKVMHTFVRQGIMTKDEYIKELKSVKGIR